MCGNMADIQSVAAEIRRGKKKKEEEERRTNHSMKIYMVRATINKQTTGQKYNGLPYYIGRP